MCVCIYIRVYVQTYICVCVCVCVCMRVCECEYEYIYMCYSICFGFCVRDYQRFALSSPSVPTLYLKDPRRRVDTIQPDLLLTVR